MPHDKCLCLARFVAIERLESIAILSLRPFALLAVFPTVVKRGSAKGWGTTECIEYFTERSTVYQTTYCYESLESRHLYSEDYPSSLLRYDSMF